MSQTPTNARQHLEKLLAEFHDAMLVTRRLDGHLRSRPMALVDIRDDGTVCFATAIDSPKTEELEHDPRVNVALQSGDRFVSITGIGKILSHHGLLDRLWSESWKVWFPAGPDDPSLCLLAVEPVETELWDRPGSRGIKHLFRAAKAYLDGTQSSTDEDQDGKVKP